MSEYTVYYAVLRDGDDRIQHTHFVVEAPGPGAAHEAALARFVAEDELTDEEAETVVLVALFAGRPRDIGPD